MRLRTGIAALGMLVGACSTASTPPAESTVPADTVEQDPTRIVGALPDGTSFDIEIDGRVSDVVEGISAAIVIDVGGARNAVGVVTFVGDASDSAWYEDGVYIPAGAGFQIEFYGEILDEFGTDAEWIITNSITGREVSGYPVLVLGSPFQWATDDELPHQMEVQYRDFVVRRGCGEMAVACSPAGTVQVIPADRVFAPAPAWGGLDVQVGG